MKQIRWIIIVFLLCILLTGCWDSIELNESIMVVGIGVSKQDDMYNIILEAITPSESSPTESASKGKSTLLQAKSKTLFDAAREIIRIAKRRLFFTHAEVWVLHEDLVKEEDMVTFLDVVRREHMLRLNSYLFVSKEPPKNIFSTDFTFSTILSEELISGIEFSEYVSDYPSVKARDFFKRLLSPLQTGFLPTIDTIKNDGKILSKLTGAAIFKKGKMVGKLNPRESFGLMWLNDEVKGGSVTVDLPNGEAASFKLIRGKADIHTQLKEEALDVTVHITAKGALADQIVTVDSMDEWLDTFQKEVSKRIKGDIHQALQKLQKDMKTDATLIGIQTYRKQPQQFNQVKSHWDDVFSDATIQIIVDTTITNEGLIDKPGFHTEE